jgi:hypothetical protein
MTIAGKSGWSSSAIPGNAVFRRIPDVHILLKFLLPGHIDAVCRGSFLARPVDKKNDVRAFVKRTKTYAGKT